MSQENPTVYVVTSGCDDDLNIEGVFSTRALADGFVGEGGGDGVEEYVLDEKAGWVRRTRYRCELEADGYLREWGIGEVAAPETLVPADKCDASDYWGIVKAHAESYVSAEHARELAHEAIRNYAKKEKPKKLPRVVGRTQTPP